jgi:hypothetical protein
MLQQRVAMLVATGVAVAAVVIVPGSPALAAATDIGVVPASRSCPSNLEAVIIRMDDEDDGNANSRSGFIGAIRSDSNTEFFFCRVNGTSFRNLRGPSGNVDSYAVMKLGTTCPNGSQEFARHFDNEDDNNRNRSEGNIVPNVSDHNTTLVFCLFAPSSASTMTAFPSLGFGYGVFGAFRNDGFLHTDDEDSGNANSYQAPANIRSIAQSIVSDGRNTTIKMIRAR